MNGTQWGQVGEYSAYLLIALGLIIWGIYKIIKSKKKK